ncbi:MAG TPA: hypothetical protein VHX14_03055 [Thermoanaerobaculia bacterium]|jgi:hypothetical protein|nr:hypothetical protein [Thermoanaerobaculia bacterium]
MRLVLVSLASLLILGCNPIQESHIDANVPDSAAFDRYLQRDLKSYFSGADVTVDLLRREPTQSGVAYPKFYAWIHAIAPGAPAVDGVVRMEAVDRQKFVVTHFLSVQEIRSDPGQVDAIFPAPLCSGIKHRAGVTGD